MPRTPTPSAEAKAPRPCATCGGPLSYSGRGRRPVVHAGACARLRANEVDEDRREARYREALRDAAVRAPLPGPEHVDTDGGDVGTMQRLGEAGFAPLFDDPAEERENVPKHELARTAHRRAVLTSLTSVDDPNTVGPAVDTVIRCLDCPMLAALDGVRGVLTSASLSNVSRIAEDRRLRRLLGEDGLGALLARRPA